MLVFNISFGSPNQLTVTTPDPVTGEPLSTRYDTIPPGQTYSYLVDIRNNWNTPASGAISFSVHSNSNVVAGVNESAFTVQPGETISRVVTITVPLDAEPNGGAQVDVNV